LLIAPQDVLDDLGKPGAGAGVGFGTVSDPSSRARYHGGEEALGGLSLREAGRLSDEDERWQLRWFSFS